MKFNKLTGLFLATTVLFLIATVACLAVIHDREARINGQECSEAKQAFARGASDPCVRVFKQKLNYLAGTQLKVTDEFDEELESAMSGFQRFWKLEETRAIGTKDWETLDAFYGLSCEKNGGCLDRS